MWYRTGKMARYLTAQEKQNDVITELDVSYGSDRAWYGFEKIEPSVTIEKGRVSSEWITYRKGVKRTSLLWFDFRFFFFQPAFFRTSCCPTSPLLT